MLFVMRCTLWLSALLCSVSEIFTLCGHGLPIGQWVCAYMPHNWYNGVSQPVRVQRNAHS